MCGEEERVGGDEGGAGRAEDLEGDEVGRGGGWVRVWVWRAGGGHGGPREGRD